MASLPSSAEVQRGILDHFRMLDMVERHMAGNLRGPIAEGPWNPHMIQETGRPMYALPVSDIIKLAAAGVKIEFKDIANQIMPDPVQPQTAEPSDGLRDYHNRLLVRPIVDRWRMANQKRDMEGHAFPFLLSAQQYKEKVYVFVGTGNSEPCILTDEAHLYPSDALMAKLHLLQQTETKTAGYNSDPAIKTGTARYMSGDRMQIWNGHQWTWTWTQK